ncbi:hypothetical protein SNARM312S_03539 [Streptomyces narbonensis]
MSSGGYRQGPGPDPRPSPRAHRARRRRRPHREPSRRLARLRRARLHDRGCRGRRDRLRQHRHRGLPDPRDHREGVLRLIPRRIFTMDAVSYTAQWMAAARSIESEREDALFVDPPASDLAAPRGFELIERYDGGGLPPFISIRTRFLDDAIKDVLAEGGIQQVLADRGGHGHPGVPPRLAGGHPGLRGRPRPPDRGEASPPRRPSGPSRASTGAGRSARPHPGVDARPGGRRLRPHPPDPVGRGGADLLPHRGAGRRTAPAARLRLGARQPPGIRRSRPPPGRAAPSRSAGWTPSPPTARRGSSARTSPRSS